jgi:enoyl-CoA hydratase/carnithine racemase
MELTGAAIVAVPEALNLETVRNLSSALAAAFADRNSAVVVLTGGERVFCKGLDWNASIAEDDPRASVKTFAHCLETVTGMRGIATGASAKPVIAFVRGEVAGGGVGLVAACDGVLAAPDATFTLPELLFGLTPAVIFPYVAQRVPAQKLRWLALTAATLTAKDALKLGLVDEVCSRANAPGLLRSWIRRLRRLRPELIAEWKEMTMTPRPRSNDGLNDGVERTVSRLLDVCMRDAMRTFLETGEAPWMQRETDRK